MSRARIQALSLADEDYYLLGEYVGALEPNDSTLTRNDRLRLAESTLGDLLQEGLIELFFADWPPTEFSAIDRDHALRLLTQEASWAIGAEAAVEKLVWFSATEQGRKAYSKLPSSSFGDPRKGAP